MNLYIETSVWNMLVDADPVNREKRSITERFFEEVERRRHRIFVSRLVLEEVARDSDDLHRKILQSEIDLRAPALLVASTAVLSLGREYVIRGFVPEKYEDDAVHIAFAVVNGLDAIVSWNMQHIAKTRTRVAVRCYNEEVGLHVPDMATPEEVIDDVEDDG